MICTNRGRNIGEPVRSVLPSATASAGPGRAIAWIIALAAVLAIMNAPAPPAHATEPAEAASVSGEPAATTSPAATLEPAAAPEDRTTLGVDLVSRYVWRGQAYGDAPCFQPWAGINVAGFTLSTWGSFALAPVQGGTADSTSLTEVDISLSRSHTLSIGTITGTLNDFHYPSAGISYFEFADGGAGGHTVDISVAYRGPDAMPLGLGVSVDVYNDDDHATYVEASWPLTTGSTEVSLAAGAALGKSALYDVDKGGVHVIQAAVTASKPLPISDAFVPTLKVSWILNPYKERVALVVALSL